eukprot:UN02537
MDRSYQKKNFVKFFPDYDWEKVLAEYKANEDRAKSIHESCDLTGDDDEDPVWTTGKKNVKKESLQTQERGSSRTFRNLDLTDE